MALVIDSVQRMRTMTTLAKYVVVFFHDSHAVPTSDFKSSIGKLLNMRKVSYEHKYVQIDTQKVPIPRETFGFEAYSGVIFYRGGKYINYMNGFNESQFVSMLHSLPTLAEHDISRIINHKLNAHSVPRTVTLLGNGQDIYIPGAGVEKVVIYYK
ncbi:hypothetical protein LPJ78_002040 [Coemansia sp. RSA 989]|nr:hypothetical protein LPJ68_003034 [Coemansia sp. RSA 1086]KAJ1751512.1 hypothetical protein LPJ79_001990 [Coemansia sp. RSA 1821]KAJ1866217.1 hypothetical protein LPJ78_002040 [Coemansia sp. RSA 989]KAJ1873446.1 hypothetical protein LPJ55_002301 [Coemansia sp. RSA 990]KAJ2633299.1 hypothetical protein H4R22_000583 [Coemansia sp. RSA 1290]KAJ2647952.1 hypothetical protein IWW40_004275 [Coemansia sp. RSA 1250]KAJ2670036.1 hypothetical protein IWW42_004236 [Coemansia sp. RSA 1085]